MAQKSVLSERFAASEAFKAGEARARSYLLIGQELRTLRERSGLTQQMLAAQSGVDQADISRLESGKWGARGISFDTLGRLLPVFGLRISHQVRSEPTAEGVDAARLASARAITQLLVA